MTAHHAYRFRCTNPVHPHIILRYFDQPPGLCPTCNAPLSHRFEAIHTDQPYEHDKWAVRRQLGT